MQDYLIAIWDGEKLAAKPVQGEPLTIEGFEGVQLFSFRTEAGYWNISEAITGMAIARDIMMFTELSQAVDFTAAKLLKTGKGGVIKTIRSHEKVKDLPLWTEAKKKDN